MSTKILEVMTFKKKKKFFNQNPQRSTFTVYKLHKFIIKMFCACSEFLKIPRWASLFYFWHSPLFYVYPCDLQ